MSKSKSNPLRFFLYFPLSSKSEARLKHIKKGTPLASTLSKAKQREAETCDIQDVPYEPVDFFLSRNGEKGSSEMTPAMKEYISSKYFSPSLEKKKYENIDKFFIVRFKQEKYQIINSIFQDSRSGPLFPASLKTDEKKIGDSPDRVKEKDKGGDVIDLRIRLIDEAIKKTVDDEANRELKKNEDERKIINLQVKKKNKRGLSLSQKFFALNMKSRYILENLSQTSAENRKALKTGSLMQEITARSAISSKAPDKHFESTDSRFRFPAINKR